MKEFHTSNVSPVQRLSWRSCCPCVKFLVAQKLQIEETHTCSGNKLALSVRIHSGHGFHSKIVESEALLKNMCAVQVYSPLHLLNLGDEIGITSRPISCSSSWILYDIICQHPFWNKMSRHRDPNPSWSFASVLSWVGPWIASNAVGILPDVRIPFVYYSFLR